MSASNVEGDLQERILEHVSSRNRCGVSVYIQHRIVGSLTVGKAK